MPKVCTYCSTIIGANQFWVTSDRLVDRKTVFFVGLVVGYEGKKYKTLAVWRLTLHTIKKYRLKQKKNEEATQ